MSINQHEYVGEHPRREAGLLVRSRPIKSRVRRSPRPDLERLTNGQFEVVVSPATGRIVRYGPVGGPNVLWENPRAATTRSPFEGWINWGGDKVWIWPEDDWATWQRGAVRPPGDPPASPYQVEVGRLTMRMISPLVPAYGVRIVREISLAAEGSGVASVNRLEKANEAKPRSALKPLAVSVWTLTQIPAARRILARLLPDVAPPRYQPFPRSPWKGVRVLNDIALLTRPAAPWVKLGLEADALAMAVGKQLLVIRAPVDRNAPSGYEPFRRAQVFSDPDQSEFRPAGLPPYVEFEFTSPLKYLSVGESVTLTVTWELHRLTKAGPSAAEIIAASPSPHSISPIPGRKIS